MEQMETSTECQNEVRILFKNREKDGRLNLCGPQVAKFRVAAPEKLSQRALADRLQLAGLDLGKNAIQRIECGQRFVTDIELNALAQVLHVTVEQLLSPAE